MVIVLQAGIPIFVTGGVGGVHRHGHTSMDISADLTELGRTPVAVICAGIKSVLDIGRTLEYLETQGVCVATMGSQTEFPSFFSGKSAFKSPWTVSTVEEAAQLICNNFEINQRGGVLLAVPIPAEYSIPNHIIENVILQALEDCNEKGIVGKEVTPYVLGRINELTGGKSLEANQALIENNARVGSDIAMELANLKDRRFASTSYIPACRSTIERPIVIGGSNFDVVCKVNDAAGLVSNPSTVQGNVRTSFGGVARNIADALALLDCDPIFISAVGHDHLGKSILMHNKKLDKSCIEVVKNASTATYCLTLTPNGHLDLGIGDMDIHNHISPAVIKFHSSIIAQASLVVLDANCTQATIDEVLHICFENCVPVFFEPTDPFKAKKALASKYAKAIKYASPNMHELRQMAGYSDSFDPNDYEGMQQLMDDCLTCGRALIDQIPTLIITLGQFGALLLEKDHSGQIKASHFKVDVAESVASVSGAGDCLAAAFIAGLLHGHSKAEAIEMGLKAAHLSLQSMETVPSTLNMDAISLPVKNPLFS
jgi:pseudouridine-5'-phosphate glycosidase/pseudouridine kinase